MLSIQLLQDGSKNVTVRVSGILNGNFAAPKCILRLAELQGSPANVRLDEATWLLQEKLGLLLWWRDSCEVEDFILPMESRNRVTWSTGLASPREKWERCLWLTSFNADQVPCPKHFTFVLDLDKQ